MLTHWQVKLSFTGRCCLFLQWTFQQVRGGIRNYINTKRQEWVWQHCTRKPPLQKQSWKRCLDFYVRYLLHSCGKPRHNSYLHAEQGKHPKHTHMCNTETCKHNRGFGLWNRKGVKFCQKLILRCPSRDVHTQMLCYPFHSCMYFYKRLFLHH